MSRPPKNEMAAQELGMRLTELNDKLSPQPKCHEIELWIFARFEARFSDETIRRAHRGDLDPTTCNVQLLTALSAFYEVSPEALGHFASAEVAKTMAMLHVGGDDTHPRNGSLDGPSDLAGDRLSCTSHEDALVLTFDRHLPTATPKAA